MTRLGTLLQLAAAVLVTAAATLVLPATAAHAETCAESQIGVVLDFGALGGGTATGCGVGSTADKAFSTAGVSLKQQSRQPGFVCQVNNKPGDGACLGTESYWGFFVSHDGKGWVYASQGVYQQSVVAGDSVALVWQCSQAQRKPGQAWSCGGAAPTGSAVPGSGKTTKQPKPKPTKRPVATRTPSVAPTTTAPVPSPAASSTTAKKSRHTPTPSPSTSEAVRGTSSSESSPSASASPSASPSTSVAIAPTASHTDGGLPGWVPPLLVAALALGAGGVAWVRRTR